MLSEPVSASWQRAPLAIASERRAAMSGLWEKWPGDDSNNPAPVAREPVSKSEMTMASNERVSSNVSMRTTAPCADPNTGVTSEVPA